MAETKDYGRIGRFIYSAHRDGANGIDIHNWMADELAVARPSLDDNLAAGALYTAFFTKYARDDELQAQYERFIGTIRDRNS